MYSKKGVVEIQFNWIFVLIAGFVIITLFTTIIVKQRDASDKSINVMVLNSLDAILSGSETSAGTVNIVRLPETKIEFATNGYSVGTVSKQFNALNVFTPSVLEGTSIITMTLEWSIPYRVTNFVYLTNNKIRYAFVGDTDNIFNKKIFDSIPDEVNKDGNMYPGANHIPDRNDEEIRIIFLNQDTDPVNLKAKKITALKVISDGDKGELEFFDFVGGQFKPKDPSDYKSYYIKEETLLGAIFTDDIEIYNTVMKNAFKKLNIVSQVYQQKTDNLVLGPCNVYYNSAYLDIDTIRDKSNTFSSSSIEDIVAAAEDLEIQNKNLLKKSCPLIY